MIILIHIPISIHILLSIKILIDIWLSIMIYVVLYIIIIRRYFKNLQVDIPYKHAISIDTKAF